MGHKTINTTTNDIKNKTESHVEYETADKSSHTETYVTQETNNHLNGTLYKEGRDVERDFINTNLDVFELKLQNLLRQTQYPRHHTRRAILLI